MEDPDGSFGPGSLRDSGTYEYTIPYYMRAFNNWYGSDYPIYDSSEESGLRTASQQVYGSLTSTISTTAFQFPGLDTLPVSDEPYVTCDSLGRYTALVDVAGGVTRFTYDAAGNLASLTDADGNTTSWVYDSAGEVIEATGPAAVDMTVPSVVDLIHAAVNDWLAETTESNTGTPQLAFDGKPGYEPIDLFDELTSDSDAASLPVFERSVLANVMTEDHIEVAEAELRAAGVDEEEIRLRVSILRAIFTGVVTDIGDKRDFLYWRQRRGQEAFVVRYGKSPVEAIDRIWTYAPGKVYCQKYSSLILIKGYIDLARQAYDNCHESGFTALKKLDEVFYRKIIPDDLPNEGEGLFWTTIENPTTYLPGDQVWFKNPHYHYMAPQKKGAMPPSAGEEGSNVFYIGAGKVVSIYEHGGKAVYTIEEYQSSMANGWNTTQDWQNGPVGHAPITSDFRIASARRPLAPWEFYTNLRLLVR